LQACVAWGVPLSDVLSAIARSSCKQQVVFAVYKALCGDGVAGVPFLCCLSSALFELLWTMNNGMKKTATELFVVVLFFMSLCVKLSFFCITKCLS